MKIIFFIFLFFPSLAFSQIISVDNPKVIDGDTIDSNISIYGLPSLKIRIYGIDTPEIKGKCEKERYLALKAKKRLEQLVGKNIRVEILDWDKYGGRIIGNVYTSEGFDVSKILIYEKLAYPYHGELKQTWCK